MAVAAVVAAVSGLALHPWPLACPVGLPAPSSLAVQLEVLLALHAAAWQVAAAAVEFARQHKVKKNLIEHHNYTGQLNVFSHNAQHTYLLIEQQMP